MRVYLVYTDVSSNHGIPYHPGLASIGALLLQRGHQVKLGYIDSVDQYQDIVDAVNDFEPDIVGFTTVETQFVHVQRLAAMIKKWGKELGTIIAERKVRIGMTQEQVIDAWGKPKDINKTISRNTVHEQWVYGLGSYLYFEVGVLTTIQN